MQILILKLLVSLHNSSKFLLFQSWSINKSRNKKCGLNIDSTNFFSCEIGLLKTFVLLNRILRISDVPGKWHTELDKFPFVLSFLTFFSNCELYSYLFWTKFYGINFNMMPENSQNKINMNCFVFPQDSAKHKL